MAHIYKVTSRTSKKSYVGYTSRDDIELRMREHFAPSVYGPSDLPFYNAIKKYGTDDWDYISLYEGEDALEKESEYISQYGDYNVHEGGNLPPRQKGNTWKLSEETKQKMRKPKPPRTKEHRENLSKSLKGNTPWNKGKKGVHECPWKGKRYSNNMAEWKITKEDGTEIITENLIVWCEENGYKTNTVKGRYYKKKLPYMDIVGIEKLSGGKKAK